MWPPTISVRPSASWMWPAQKRLRPYGTGGERCPSAGFQSRSEFGAASKPSSVKTCARRLERHVHGDERPRDGRAPVARPGPASRGRRRSSRRAGRAPRRARPPRAQARCHEGIRRQAVGVGCCSSASSVRRRLPPERSFIAVRPRRTTAAKFRPDLAVRSGIDGGHGARGSRRTSEGSTVAPSPSASRRTRELGNERDAPGGHRHEDELEPERAEDRRREDVAEREDRAGRHQASCSDPRLADAARR